MANSTLAVLRSKFRIQMKPDPNGKMISDDSVNNFINIATSHVLSDLNYASRFSRGTAPASSTVNGTQEYDLPEGFVRFELIKVDKTNLEETTRADILKVNEDFLTGKPTHYYLESDTYGLHPIPESVETIKIEYLKQANTLVDDSDISSLPVGFDEAIAIYAAYVAYSTINRYRNQAEAKLVDYEREKANIRRINIPRQSMNNVMK